MSLAQSFPRIALEKPSFAGLFGESRRGRDSNPRNVPPQFSWIIWLCRAKSRLLSPRRAIDLCGNCGRERFFCGCYPPEPWDGRR